MTLHEAIAKLLSQSSGMLSATQIADALNKNKWYKKRDNSKIRSSQIRLRVKNYPNLFKVTASGISLSLERGAKKAEHLQKPIVRVVNQMAKAGSIGNPDSISLANELMEEKNFVGAGQVDSMIPVGQCGMYCIRIRNVEELPKECKVYLSQRGHNIIYIGIATTCLNKRFLNQELRANGHGTFFRSIGALLGYRPPKGSLLTKANKRNYKFSATDNFKIIQWINTNLLVYWVKLTDNFENIETDLIRKHEPLLNIAKNPSALKSISEARAACVRVANTQ